MKPIIAAAAATALLVACQSTPPAPLRATAQLQPTKGNKTFGEATFEQVGNKVVVVVYVQGLKPGQDHGFHIHEVGDCSSGDGMSAQGQRAGPGQDRRRARRHHVDAGAGEHRRARFDRSRGSR
jgi:Cu-Zn family superoxide dismutase